MFRCQTGCSFLPKRPILCWATAASAIFFCGYWIPVCFHRCWCFAPEPTNSDNHFDPSATGRNFHKTIFQLPSVNSSLPPYLCAKFQQSDGFWTNKILICSGFQLTVGVLFLYVVCAGKPRQEPATRRCT